MIKDGGGDARCKNGEQPAVPVSKKQEVLRLLHCGASNQIDRGAIRPYGSQNGMLTVFASGCFLALEQKRGWHLSFFKSLFYILISAFSSIILENFINGLKRVFFGIIYYEIFN